MKHISKCPISNKIIGIWSNIPGYYNLKGQFIKYEIGYYCNHNKMRTREQSGFRLFFYQNAPRISGVLPERPLDAEIVRNPNFTCENRLRRFGSILDSHKKIHENP